MVGAGGEKTLHVSALSLTTWNRYAPLLLLCPLQPYKNNRYAKTSGVFSQDPAWLDIKRDRMPAAVRETLASQHATQARWQAAAATALVVFCIICTKLNNTVLPILSSNSKDNSLFYQWSK